jgi:hypothetical protein
MKILKLFTISLLVFTATARAQPGVAGLIRVGLETAQDEFIPGEAMVARIGITNLSGRTINFRATEPWLNLSIVDSQNLPVNKLEEVSIHEDFSIANGEIASIPVEVNRFFEMIDPGRYSIRMTVSVRELGDEIHSAKAAAVQVVKGTVLWEQEFGVPGREGTPPEARKFALQQAPTGRLKKLNLYVRLSDAGGAKILKTFPISTLVGFSKPEAQIDASSNFHVLNQSGQRSFDYFVFDPEGTVIIHQIHEYSDTIPSTRPRLGHDPDGRILVLQGQRRFTARDIPPNPKPISNAQP